MAQFTENDVKRVVAAIDAVVGDGNGGPALRREDVDRVLAITNEPDLSLRARKMDAWLGEVRAQLEANTQRLSALRTEAGVPPAGESGELSAAAKAELERALDNYASGVLDEVRREARAAMGQSQPRSSRMPRAGRIRV